MTNESLILMFMIIITLMFFKTCKLVIDGYYHLRDCNYKQYKEECSRVGLNPSLRDFINKDSTNVLTWAMNLFIAIYIVDISYYFFG